MAGPAGLLLSVGVIGIVAICVGESIAELAQQFPVYNAIVEYVRVFVDEELGWVVGVAYWYTFASVFAVQNLAAANLSQYWGLDQTWQTLAFYILAPLVILILNFLGVFYYGVVETIGGFLKICLVLGVSIFLYVIAAQRELSVLPSVSEHDQGIKANLACFLQMVEGGRLAVGGEAIHPMPDSKLLTELFHSDQRWL